MLRDHSENSVVTKFAFTVRGCLCHSVQWCKYVLNILREGNLDKPENKIIIVV